MKWIEEEAGECKEYGNESPGRESGRGEVEKGEGRGKGEWKREEEGRERGRGREGARRGEGGEKGN